MIKANGLPPTLEDYRESRRLVRQFIQANYSDSDLVFALDRCRSGEMRFSSCCCLIGIPTRESEPQFHDLGLPFFGLHYFEARAKPDALIFEAAYWCFVYGTNYYGSDLLRQKRLIPMLKAEIRRRIRERGTVFNLNGGTNETELCSPSVAIRPVHEHVRSGPVLR